MIGELDRTSIRGKGGAVLFDAYHRPGGVLCRVDAQGVDHDEDAARAWIEHQCIDQYDAERVILAGWHGEFAFEKGRWRPLAE